jgi:hypothetical protein
VVAYSFKRRFVDPIRVGLSRVSLSFDCQPKHQTIRAIGKRRHARPGETLQLYCAMRTRQCFKIGEARCIEVSPIAIAVNLHTMPITLNGQHLGGGRIHEFAQADGFDHGEDMHEFWKAEHGLGPFEGVLIRWEPFT